jgi:hypothetical protein
MAESDPPPPVMRGDLFALLDPEAGGKDSTPNRIASAAKKLSQRVMSGERAPGPPVVMQCLDELTQLSDGKDPMRAFWALSSIRQRLLALGLARSRTFPGKFVGERVLVLPQSRLAQIVRVMPSAEGAVWYVATREAFPSYAQKSTDLPLPEGRPELDDTALGPPRIELAEVTFRLFRFGESAADIRLCMRVVQEPGSFCDIIATGDGERVALLSRDVIGVFESDGKPILSGRLPIDAEADKGGEVTALALQGDILGINLRAATDKPVELALIAVSERKGFPVGVVGDDAQGLLLGPRQAYVLDGVQLVRLPLFGAPPDEPVKVFPVRPWFAEYVWSARHLLAWDGKRVWLSNGHKIIVLDESLDLVRAEIVLPEPIVDLHVSAKDVRLVHFEPGIGRVRIAHWEIG